MKKNLLVVISLLVTASMLMFFTGCADNDDDNDIDNGNDVGPVSGIFGPEDLDPDNYDFFLGIYYGIENRPEDHYIIVMPVNPDYSDADVSLTANGQPIELMTYEWFDEWFGSASLEEGESYIFELTTGSESYSADLTIPYNTTSISFPETYDPTQSHEVTWTLANDNENQFAYADSRLGEPDEYYDETDLPYIEVLNPSDRQHTFPADIVETYGPETKYELGILQTNFEISGRFATIAISPDHRTYDEEQREVTHLDIREHVIRLIEILK